MGLRKGILWGYDRAQLGAALRRKVKLHRRKTGPRGAWGAQTAELWGALARVHEGVGALG